MDVQAATCTWTGAVSTDWNTIGNWSGCINLGDGSLNPGETLALEAGALLVDSGTLSSNLVNGGTISPGESPGIIPLMETTYRNPVVSLRSNWEETRLVQEW